MAHTGQQASPLVPPGAGRTARLDASMGLLREVMERPLDPGYASAKRRREAGERPPNRWVTVAFAAVLAFVTVWAVLTLRTPSPDVVSARSALEQQIEDRSAQVQTLQASNAEARTRIAAAQATQLARQGGQPLVDRAQRLGLVTGELAVSGPGLELSLDDAPGAGDVPVGVDPRDDAEAQDGRVLDRDLQVVVNGLWAAGAEAVAVNGQRLTSLSAIRSAGLAILVDFRPLVPPYVVLAVGDPDTLQSGFAAGMAGPYVQSLRDNYDISTSLSVRERLDLPGAGQISLRYATPTTSVPPTPGSATSTPSQTPAAEDTP